MKLYGIVNINYEHENSDELRGYGMHQDLFTSYKDANDYLCSKGYVGIGYSKYEIPNGEFDYTAEIFELEAPFEIVK